jgi:hypothetical protein
MAQTQSSCLPVSSLKQSDSGPLNVHFFQPAFIFTLFTLNAASLALPRNAVLGYFWLG